MFLGHDWLVKHNPKVNWKNGTIRFTRCPESCIIKHEDIRFKTRRTKATKQQKPKNKTMVKSARNQTRQIQKIYQSTFDLSHIYSTRRSSKSY